MSLWTDIGYSRNPYSVEPLGATAEGAQLLVGRDRELQRLLTQLTSTDTHPTVEGDNGVGKTSLVAVAVYQGMAAFLEGRTTELLIPLAQPLQIDEDASKLERRAYSAILQAYIDHAEKLEAAGLYVPDTTDMRRWAGEPIIHSYGGGASAAGFGVSGSHSQALNTTPGFVEGGMHEQVQRWLTQTFPPGTPHAFVGIIDNLELLQTSTEARRVLDRLRDTLLALPGVHWVLCGAKGIVRSAASWQRMQGRISTPIEVSPIPDALVPELIRRRLQHYATRPDPEAPVSPESFGHLYAISHNNLRSALKYAQDFTVWLSEEDLLQAPPDQKVAYLEIWAAQEADALVQAANLQKRQWELFDDIAARGGSIAPGDHERFDFNSPQAMRTHVARLEQANFIDSTIDDSDQRRRTITITSLGWLVHYRRSGFQAIR